MIDRGVIDNVLDTANGRIVDVVSDFVSLRRRGVNYVGCCPFHDEKTGSFTVSPAKGIFKCFGCGKAGNALNFVMEIEHLTFVEGIKFLGEKFHIDVVDQELTPEMEQLKSDRESMMAVTDYAANFFADNLWNTDEGKSVGISYFRERGFRDDIIKLFGLGYSPQKRDAFTSAALSSSFKLEFLTKTGLTISGEHDYRADRFFGRVMFPIHGLTGKVIAFGGRVMQKSAKTAKYLNSPESELYHKSKIVYGIYQAKAEIVRHDRCFLVEGYTDVISMHQSGITNVVASSGTSLTQDQIKLIQRFTSNITVLYDGDYAGIKASLRGIDMILAEGMAVKVLLLPDGEDPDSYAQSHTSDEFLKFIADNETDFIKFKATLLLKDAQNDPIKRAELIQNMVNTIAVIPNEILRSVYVKECSSMMQVDELTLYSALQKRLRSNVAKPVYQASAPAEPVAGAVPADVRQQTETSVVASTVETNVPTVNPYECEEREVLRFLVRYYDRMLFDGSKDEKITVGNYIVGMLQEDGLRSCNTLYAKMFDIYSLASSDGTLNDHIFISNPDPAVSSLASELIGGKYELSKIHFRYAEVPDETALLDELVPHVVCELKLKKVKLILAEARKKIKKAELEHADDKIVDEILKEIMTWENVKRMLSSMLGGRTLI